MGFNLNNIEEFEIMKDLLILLILGSILTSCYIGPGGICGPQTFKIYCESKEEQDKFFKTKYMVEYWEHPSQPSTDVEQRLQDWRDCGGDNDGHLGVRDSLILPGETSLQSVNRRSAEIERCMLKIGYKYTGSCTSDFSKATPACGAP